MIVAIDGPAAAGKSTVARNLARKLGLRFLDTGAMYRAIAWKVLLEGIDPRDAVGCERVANETQLSFDDLGRVLVDGVEGEPHIRSVDVTLAASPVATHFGVRNAMVPQQRRVAKNAPKGVVAEGRDTTTVVFPDADYKVYLSASAKERARRRAEQEGNPERASEIEAEIERRDRTDSERDHSPLRVADDAIVIETDEHSADEVVRAIYDQIRVMEREREKEQRAAERRAALRRRMGTD